MINNKLVIILYNFKKTVLFSCLALALSACTTNYILPKSSSDPLDNANIDSNKSAVAQAIEQPYQHTSLKNSSATHDGINDVVNANNQFAISLYQTLNNGTDDNNENIFFSPYSLSSAMAMIYNAAGGETKQQIAAVFHYPSLDILNPNSAVLYDKFNKPKSEYDLTIANDLWVQTGLQPKQNYLNTLKQYYGSGVTNLDFAKAPEASRYTINTAISEYTQQMIPEILGKSSITPDTQTVLTNAVYFKGQWTSPFISASTRLFYRLDGSTQETEFMTKLSQFLYTEDDNNQIVQIPYEGGELSMMIILPKSKDKSSMDNLINGLTQSKINQWSHELKNKEVMLFMPKFKLAESYSLKEVLTKMGMPAAFSNQADFSLFSDETNLKIDSIVHKAVVEVDKKGTRAAAATRTIVVPIMGMYEAELNADHPFIFIIKDNTTGTILFMGQVNKI